MRRLALLSLGALAAVAACEVPLDPIADSDLVYTFSGYLDASADTQVVRVEPVAPTALADPGLIDADVTLTDLASGATVALDPSVTTFPTGPAHLFRTDAPIALGGRYRLAARRSDGAESSTEIEIPAPGSYSIVVRPGPKVCPTAVTIAGAERVVDVQARYVIEQGGRRVERRFSHADTFAVLDDGSLRASVYFGVDALEMGIDPISMEGLISAELVVAISTDAWPDPLGITLEEALQMETGAVENGLGFVGGAVTETRGYVPGVIEIGFGAEFRPCVPGG